MATDRDDLRDAVTHFYSQRAAPFKDAEHDAVLDNGSKTETGYEPHIIKAAFYLRQIVDHEVAQHEWRQCLEDAMDEVETAQRVAEQAGAQGVANSMADDHARLKEIHAAFAE